MEKDNQILLIRTACWAGVLADAFFAIAMVYPPLWGFVFAIPDFAPDIRYRIDMGVGASLMLGWTCLLIWADRKPIERRGVLMLTVFPVLTGLGITGTLSILSGTASFMTMLPVFMLKITLIPLMLTGYLKAGRIEKRGTLA